ncbi:MAG: hypothetical protein AAB776_04280 [Patescibacteria group bacterium]
MYDDRKEGVNLLNPEAGSVERETNFEAQETGPELAPRQDETPKVDKQHLSNVKSTITVQEPVAEAPAKDPLLTQIEGILSENLGEIYSQLPEDKREAFRLKGEEVAGKIHEMMTTAKIKVHKILKLVSDWLGMIPGVNVYFLRQEAKLKLDKLMDYSEEQAKTSQNAL